VLTILISCSKTLELKVNPFELNFNATIDDLGRWGFENKFYLNNGACIYTRNIQQRVDMYFYLSVEDDCYKTTGQGITINLDTLEYHVTSDELVPPRLDQWFLQNRQEFNKDSLEIIDLLNTYGGQRFQTQSDMGIRELEI